MMFRTGDRVRVTRKSPEGAPAFEYGFLERIDDGRTHAVVLLDDELSPQRVALADIAPIEIATVELCIDTNNMETAPSGEPALRDELIVLWQAEAEQAGIDVESLVALPTGSRADLDTWALAELHAGGVRFLLRARFAVSPPTVHVHAVPHYPQN